MSNPPDPKPKTPAQEALDRQALAMIKERAKNANEKKGHIVVSRGEQIEPPLNFHGPDQAPGEKVQETEAGEDRGGRENPHLKRLQDEQLNPPPQRVAGGDAIVAGGNNSTGAQPEAGTQPKPVAPPESVPGGPAVLPTVRPTPEAPSPQGETPQPTGPGDSGTDVSGGQPGAGVSPEAGGGAEPGRPGGLRRRASEGAKQVGGKAKKALSDRYKKIASKITKEAIKKAVIFLASQWWFWVIIVVVIIIVVAAVYFSSFLGLSSSSPNAMGKSLPQYSQPYDLKGVLADLIAESNIDKASEILQTKKDQILSALEGARTEINTNYSTSPNKAQAISLLNDVTALVNTASTTDATQNVKLVSPIKDKFTQLVNLFSVAVVSLNGTALPINPSSVSGESHTASRCYPYIKEGGNHNAFFGWHEINATGTTDAEAVDLGGNTGDTVYAPFTGNLEHNGSKALILTGSAGGQQLQAILAHCDAIKTGNVQVGEPVCHLVKQNSPHLHFELKVNGQNVHRDTCDQPISVLWDKMTTILGGKK